MLNFTSIGEKYYTDKIDVGDAIESLQWEEVTPQKTYPMAQGMAIEKAIQENEALYKGVNICQGKVTYKTVADDLGLKFEKL